jgi:putative endonuclease
MGNQMTYQKDVGAWGESVACAYLEAQGYGIIDRNCYTRFGEIEIICTLAETLVFFEIKTRTSNSFGLPEDSVTENKKQHLINAALLYLEEHPEYEDWEFDLISVEGKFLSPNPTITHFRNAIVE